MRGWEGMGRAGGMSQAVAERFRPWWKRFTPGEEEGVGSAGGGRNR